MSVLLAACGSPSHQGDVAVRDSAGIQIVESASPAWSDTAGWRLSDEPTLSIGIQEGDPAYQLYRAFSGLRLPDGRIVIGNTGSHEVRFYDAQGRHLRSVGREGEGPGEYAQFTSMRMWRQPNREIVVVDDKRVHVYSDSGDFRRTIRLEAVPGRRPPFLRDAFGDGTWLGLISVGDFADAPGTVFNTTWRYYRYASDGTPLGELAVADARPRFVNRIGQITNFPFIPFTAEPSVAAGDSTLVFGRGVDAEIERRALDGTVRAIVRWTDPERPRTAEIWERYKDHTLDELEERRVQYARFYEEDLPIPERVPAYGELIVDDVGNLWAQRHELPWDSVHTYDVFDRDDSWLGAVTMPAALTPFQIGEDFVLGRHRDALNVERVQLYALEKNDEP
jgi:hypothetical protein